MDKPMCSGNTFTYTVVGAITGSLMIAIFVSSYRMQIAGNLWQALIGYFIGLLLLYATKCCICKIKYNFNCFILPVKQQLQKQQLPIKNKKKR